MEDHDQTTTIANLVENSESEQNKQAVLIVMTGPTSGQTIHLEAKDSWILGRSTESDIIFQEASVSRSHCELRYTGKDSWEAIDLNSSNGTWINGDRIDKKSLESGDKLQLGSSIIVKFVYQDELEAAFQRELYESATKDALTGLFSKRYFNEQLDVEFNYHKRTGKPLSVVLADIDHFKKINDTYGHIAGDFILKETGRIILNVLRKGDVAGRYGGEEMIFLLRETPLQGARIFAERLRQLIAGHAFIMDGKKISVTISLGCATFTQGNYGSPLELVKSADQFLYQAKKAGRNRTCCLIDP